MLKWIKKRNSMEIASSELILNENKSIYHLHLKPSEIADTIITVGDPERVEKVSCYFDEIECKISKREFKTHTGRIGNKRVSVISTGIGTDNIDIVLNELDALVNIDFESRKVKDRLSKLHIIRLGTSGTLQPHIPVDSILLSKHAIGMDGLMHFYERNSEGFLDLFQKEVENHLQEFLLQTGMKPYAAMSSATLFKHFSSLADFSGITCTATGFYGPQNRKLRLNPKMKDFFGLLQDFHFDGVTVTNLEMETAGIYAMSNLLGHEAISINAILANRIQGQFSRNPEKTIENLIQKAIAQIESIA